MNNTTITVDEVIRSIESGMRQQRNRSRQMLATVRAQLNGAEVLNKDALIALGGKRLMVETMRMSDTSVWECMMYGIIEHMTDRNRNKPVSVVTGDQSTKGAV